MPVQCKCNESIAQELILVSHDQLDSSNVLLLNDTVATLTEEMLEIEAAMEELARRRTAIRRKINGLSPISQLPPEILTEIFQLSRRQICEDGHRLISPFFFGSICKGWRELAWSTPLLWNTISLHFARKMPDFQVHLLSDWLLRADTSPLYITLTTDSDQELIFRSMKAVITVLATRSAYWFSLDCLLPFQCHEVLNNNNFPLLSFISLRPPKGIISIFHRPPNMLLSSPKLLDVDLSGYYVSAMRLPEQLRRLKVQSLTVADCFHILLRSPQLQSCHFGKVYSPDVASTSSLAPICANLQSLEITLSRKPAVLLLDILTLPFLGDLSIVYFDGIFSLTPITSLVLRSSCSLKQLSLEMITFSDEDLIPCLEAIPSLAHLHLKVNSNGILPSTALSSRLITMLHPNYLQGHPILPNLLSIEYLGSISCDCQSLVDILGKRWRTHATDSSPSVARLTTANIMFLPTYRIPLEAQIDIRQLQDEGMLLRFQAIPSNSFR